MGCNLNYIKCTEWLDSKALLNNHFASLESKHTIISSLGIPLKYSGYFAMIPSNFDVDLHLGQYPVTDYMFIKDNNDRVRSVARNGSLNSSLYFDKDRLIYIIGLISSIPAMNKDSITENGFVSINSTLIRNAFKDYLSYLDYLILTEVLCTDGKYVQGEKSKGYKFNERYESAPLLRYDYPAFHSTTSIDSIQEEVYSEKDATFIRNDVLNYPYLSHWYLTKFLYVDFQSALSYASSIMQEKINHGWNSWDINRDKSFGNRVVRKHPRTQYYAALYNINSIAINVYKVKIDTNVHRLHSVITNMQKDYRNFLSYNGEQLTSLDISNSQPYMMCLLLNPLFWQRDSDIHLNIAMLPSNIQSLFPEEHLLEIIEYISEKIENRNISSYTEHASLGTFYEHIVDIANTELGNILTRDEAKIMMLIVFFSKNSFFRHPKARLKRLFASLYPEIYGLIELIKTSNHTAFACLLQAIESNIILHKCCRKIWDLGNQQTPVFTIHDSIATTVSHKEFVKSIMQEELTNTIGLRPHLKEEVWDKSI